MPDQRPCPTCHGRGGELVSDIVDSTKNGDPGNVREKFVSCVTCGGSGAIDVPNSDR